VLTPHAAKPIVHGVPTIFFTPTALEDMWSYIDLSHLEIGWYGLVTHRSVLGKGQSFTIEEVYLAEQQCHSTTTELTPKGQAELYSRLMTEDAEKGIKPEDPDYRVNRLRSWFHSHVSMGVSPSGQDDDEFLNFHKGGSSYFIRGICNKRGEMQLSVFFYTANLWVTDCPWKVLTPSNNPRRDAIEKEIKEKVTHLSYTSRTPVTYPPYGGGAQHYAQQDADWAGRFGWQGG